MEAAPGPSSSSPYRPSPSSSSASQVGGMPPQKILGQVESRLDRLQLELDRQRQSTLRFREMFPSKNYEEAKPFRTTDTEVRTNGHPHPEDLDRGEDEDDGPEPDEEEADVDHSRLVGDYVEFDPPSPSFVKNVRDSSGAKVRLVSNYYKVVPHPRFRRSLYAVVIHPTVEDAGKIQALVGFKRDELPEYLLTGLQLFTTIPIKKELMTFEAQLEDDASPYTISFRFKRKVTRGEPLVIQYQNALVHKMQNGLGHVRFGSSRAYFDPSGPVNANAELQLWPGFQTSLRQQEHGLLLNVQFMWKVIHTEALIHRMDRLKQDCGGDSLKYRKRCQGEMKGLTVVTKYNHFGYQIDGVDFGMNPLNTFWTTDGNEITFDQYYRQQYRVTIKDLSQPLLVVEPKLRETRRGQTEPIYLIPELCYPCREKTTNRVGGPDEETRALQPHFHLPPTKRVQKMTEFVQSICSKDDKVEMLKKWGVTLSPNPVKLTGRVIDPQKIFLGGGKVSERPSGNWTGDLKQYGMLLSKDSDKSPSLTRWAVIVSRQDSNRLGLDIPGLIRDMQDVAKKLGYSVESPEVVPVNGTDANPFVRGVDTAMKLLGGNADLLFIILDTDEKVFAGVKQRCSVHHGVPSQCFLFRHLIKKGNGLRSKLEKMLIQMRTKQGGEPWRIQNPFIKKDPVQPGVMVFGYDVHRGGPGGSESFGAMVATISSSLGEYYSTVERLPAVRQEVAPSICRMFEKCLRAFARHNGGQLPKKVIMYRDGVGEGQLQEVKETEVNGCQKKMDSIYKELGYKEVGKLTYIIVNKRINTRFFEVDPAAGQGFRNPQVGLVVDDEVTRPERYDFFLVSQNVSQGCVKPTHYNILFDESGLKPWQIQEFTFRLCHGYFNFSGTVSVPAPCMYADKLAKQTGTAIKGPAHPRLADRLHFL